MFRHGVFAGPKVPMRDLVAAGYPHAADEERAKILARLKNCAYVPWPLSETIEAFHTEALSKLDTEISRYQGLHR